MLFTDAQFAIMLTLGIFALFFILGYLGEKKSAGFFLIFAGFIFIGFSLVSSSVLSTIVSSLLVPFGIFIILLGIKKAFYTEEKKKKKSEGQ